jgi:hypothetical protein
LDKLSGYVSDIKQRFGYDINTVDEGEIQKDLRGFDLEKAKTSLKKKKDEL